MTASMRELGFRLREYLLIVGAVMILSFLVAFALAFRLQRLISGPLLHLAETARSISENRNFALRAQKEAGDETGLVIDQFNSMLERIHEQERSLARRAEELARSNKELEQFAYVASHDLQEPLRMVRSYTELFAKRYKGSLDERADEFILYITDGVQRMQTLIRDLLAYSRVGRERDRVPVDCNRVVSRAVRHLEAALRDTKGRITHDELPTVEGDEVQLVQLFQNLLSNALKFHGEAAPEVHVSAKRGDSGMFLFAVRDNGIGIDAQYAEKVFVIFQRLHTKRDFPGTGIGLAICKKIVEAHEGKIWMESVPGKGSTFYFTLPAAIPARPSPSDGPETTERPEELTR